MSATISNLREIATFLKADIYTRNFRPVELKEYVKLGSDILSVDSNARFPSEAFKQERTIQCSSTSPKRDPDHIAVLALEVVPQLSCLIFCATKQNCENVAKLLAETFPSRLKNIKTEEKENLIASIKADSNGNICPTLEKTIPFGIAYHHSGLTSDERKHLEDAYRQNIICVICCTSTLAAGVNLPAARVIIRSPYIGPHFLTLTRYKQMVGRAGRAGKCETGESILICDPRDHPKLLDLLCSKMDDVVSGFKQDETGKVLRTVVLNLIGMDLAKSIDDLVDFFRYSLLCVQIGTVLALRPKLVKEVEKLMKEGALSFKRIASGTRHASFKITILGQEQEVFPDDELEVSKLGKAAVNAGITLEDAQKVEIDLKKINTNLTLATNLQLLFAVAPQDVAASVNPDFLHFNSVIMRMTPELLQAVKHIGVTETLAMNMITNPGRIKESDKQLLKRLYVAMMLYELWNSKDVHEVSSLYKVNRGTVNDLMGCASSRAYCLFKFCEFYKEFSYLHCILEKLSKELMYCCSTELLPLMELPAVKVGRAKLMFAAGLTTVEEVAIQKPEEMVKKIKNLNMKQAQQIIRAAKQALQKEIDNCKGKAEVLKDILRPNRKKSRFV